MFRTLGAILALVMIPWYFYANQTEQRVKCVGYEITQHSPGFPDNVTCFLNGNS